MLHLLRHLFDRNSLALKTVDAEIGCNVEKKIENQKTNNILFKNAHHFEGPHVMIMEHILNLRFS